jgi:hypothetical protein
MTDEEPWVWNDAVSQSLLRLTDGIVHVAKLFVEFLHSSFPCPPILQNCIIVITNWNDPVKEDEMGRECSGNGTEEACILGFGGKARGKETTGNTKWEDDIKMDLREIGWSGIDLIDLDQDRDNWQASIFRFHKMFGNS